MTRIKNVAIAAILVTGAMSSACQTTIPIVIESGSTPASKTASSAETKKPPKAAAADTARTLANNCFTCHGPNGRSPGTIPSLSALRASDITSQMKRFRSGDITTTVMGRLAKGYSDAEIDAIAEYIASLGK